MANLALGIYNTFSGQNLWYALMYFIMVVLFTFFYTDVLFAQQNYGDNLKKQGAQIPGVVRGDCNPKVPDQGSAAHHPAGRCFPGVCGGAAVCPWIIFCRVQRRELVCC